MSQNPLPKDTLLFGEKGSYQIEHVIGHGGFGITYYASATGENLPAEVAVKEFFPKDMCSRTNGSYEVIIESFDDIKLINQLRDRFVKESRNLQKCDHPSIVKVIDTIEMNGTAYMVMELIKGYTLKEYLNKNGAMSPGLAAKMIFEVANAVKYIHSKLINHLDIKPDNIMVTNDLSRVVLIDFGLSRQYKEDNSSDSQIITAVSKGYAAPEQYYGLTRFSPESDIYSLGATLYKLVTCITPPEPRVLEEDPSAMKMPAHLPKVMIQAIRKSMITDRKARLQSADEFIAVLSGRTPIPPMPIPDPIPDPDPDPDSHVKGIVVKILFNIILIALIGVVAYYINENWSAKWQKFNYLFHMNNSEFVMSLAGVCGLSFVALIARNRAFKVTITIICAIALAGLLLNTL